MSGDRRLRVAVAIAQGLWLLLAPIVRVAGAALACPDWPLCFGALVPVLSPELRAEPAIWLAFAHRALGVAAAGGLAALGIRGWRGSGGRLATGVLLAGAAGQIGLDAAQVWTGLAPWAVVGRDGLGLVLLGLLVGGRGQAVPDDGISSGALPDGVLALAGAVVALFAALFAVGIEVSLYRAGLACPEFPACRAGVFVPTLDGAIGIHVFHRILAALFVPALAALLWLARRSLRVWSPLWWAVRLALFEIVTGWLLIELRLPAAARLVHAALALALALALARALGEMLYARGAKWT